MMRKWFSMALCALLFFVFGTASASPTPLVTPTVNTGAATGRIIELTSSGEIVVHIQERLRDLGYFSYKPTGNFQTMSVDSTIKFQQVNQLMADGRIGDESLIRLFNPNSLRSPIAQNVQIPIGPTGAIKTDPGELLVWNEVNQLMKTGESYIITDCYTGTEYSITRTGGTNHAEVKTATESDTSKMLETFGGEFNYSKRPVVLTIAAKRIAASIQGIPHSAEGIYTKTMGGSCCLFTAESLSHVGEFIDVEHNTQIYRAAGK